MDNERHCLEALRDERELRSKSAVERLVMALAVPNGGVFKTEDGSIMVKLMNFERSHLDNVNTAPVWGADIGNGQVKKDIDPGERVLFMGKAYDMIVQP